MKQRRFGKFFIANECFDEQIAAVLWALKFVPTRIEHLYHEAQFECIGYSPMFRELSEGEILPEYSLEISFFGDEASVTVTERV